MTDRQIFRFFAVDRDEEGRPKQPTGLSKIPSDREFFASHCFLGGVYDRAAVARLWRDEQTRQLAAEGQS